MASTTQYFKKSMNAIYEIDDGAGTNISNGTITANSLSTSNFNASNLNCDNITTYTINNIANLFSPNVNYWQIQGILMRPYSKGSQYVSWFSMNYDDINNLERNGLMFEVGKDSIMQTIDDNIPYQIYTNGVKQLEMTNANGWTFGNKINSTTINNSGTITTGTLNANNATIGTLTLTSATIPTLNTTTLTATNATITNSITVPSISTTNGLFQNIQPITATVPSSLFTGSQSTLYFGGSSVPTMNINAANILLNSTGSVQLNSTGTAPVSIGNSSSGVADIYGSTINLNTTFSTGKVYMAKNGNYSLEAGINTTTAYLDFHSGNNANTDYDARIIATGGTASPGTTTGQATLALTAKYIQLSTFWAPGAIISKQIYNYQKMSNTNPSGTMSWGAGLTTTTWTNGYGQTLTRYVIGTTTPTQISYINFSVSDISTKSSNILVRVSFDVNIDNYGADSFSFALTNATSATSATVLDSCEWASNNNGGGGARNVPRHLQYIITAPLALGYSFYFYANRRGADDNLYIFQQSICWEVEQIAA